MPQPYPPPDKWQAHCRSFNLQFLNPFEDTTLWDDYLRARHACYGLAPSQPDPVDEYSSHYVAVQNNSIVGGLRVTRPSDCSLEIESKIPPVLLAEYRDALCSGSRLFKTPAAPPPLHLVRLLIEAAWMDQLRQGSRLDVIAAQTRLVPYYIRMRYLLLSEKPFLHPLRHHECWIMAFPVSKHRTTTLSHLFEDISSPFDVGLPVPTFGWPPIKGDRLTNLSLSS